MIEGKMSALAFRSILGLLGLVGVVACALALLSAWDGVWVPLVVFLPGVITLAASLWRRAR